MSSMWTSQNGWMEVHQTSNQVYKKFFNQLSNECRMAKPDSRLSSPLRNKLDGLNMDERRELVTRSTDFKDGHDGHFSPFFIACKKDSVQILEYMMNECSAPFDHKAWINFQMDYARHYATPLWYAAVAGKLNVIKCLVQHGADVNSVSNTGSTPVRSACFLRHLDVVLYLIESGADILKPNHKV